MREPGAVCVVTHRVQGPLASSLKPGSPGSPQGDEAIPISVSSSAADFLKVLSTVLHRSASLLLAAASAMA